MAKTLTLQTKNPSEEFIIDGNFQTPSFVCDYLVSLLPESTLKVLEPTPGQGNIISSIRQHKQNIEIIHPKGDYFQERDAILSVRYDAIIMNPPFSGKSFFGGGNLPASWENLKGMAYGYQFLFELMDRSDTIIALMPWFTISDSDVRMRNLLSYGLKSVTLLPRRTFQYARIQTCVLELKKGYNQTIKFEYLK